MNFCQFLPILVVKERVSGVESLDLTCLTSGIDSNFTSDDMANIWQHGIAVDRQK